ncbi:AhpC/TSA family protein [Pedobacter steynii]|nr:TlpA disulfide reductase family protein [Pedobacter steynii]NQX39308.1 AhpC/TSA family protein [Pedobacter steynii]
MKHLTIRTGLLMLVAISFTALQAQTKKNFSINGSFVNMPSVPGKVYLRYDAIAEKPADSAVVAHGKYTFKGDLETSVMATLAFVKDAPLTNKERINLMLDQGTIDIVSDQSLSRSTITGSGAIAHKEFLKVTAFAITESAALQKIKDSEGYKTDESLKAEVSKRMTNLFGRSLSDMITYAIDNPESPISPYLSCVLISSGYVRPGTSDSLYQALPAALNSSRLKAGVDAILEKRQKGIFQILDDQKKAEQKLAKVGDSAIDFRQQDINGKAVSLSSFKGKYVLIDFWASWCAPCRAEHPAIVKAYQTYKDKGFTILGVSLDSRNTKQAWLDAIKKDGLTWTQVSDLKAFENQVALLYGVTAIPQNFLIDPNHVIIARNLRGTALEQKLKEIIK